MNENEVKPDLKFIASNFEISGPDDDNLVWLNLHGNGTNFKASFNLGSAKTAAGQLALLMESDRRAALKLAEMGSVNDIAHQDDQYQSAPRERTLYDC